MLFDKLRWNEICDGYMVRDCTIGYDDNRLAFTLIEDRGDSHRENGWKTRFVAIKLNAPVESRFFWLTGGDLETASLSCAWSPGQSEFVVVDLALKVWSCSPQFVGAESPIPFDGSGYGYADAGRVGGTVNKVVRVKETVFAVGGHFRIFERLPNRQWKEHQGIPFHTGLSSGDDQKITEAISEGDCNDLSGFSLHDMYAVGGGGSVWHYNGSAWESIPFPSDRRLHTVTCAADGYVYISDIQGSLWKGRNSNWQQISRRGQSLPFVDSAWFNGTLWCANDYGMYVLEGSDLIACHQSEIHRVPDEVALVSHRIDVSPDGKRMLVCGIHGAAMHDGTQWNMLFSDEDFLDKD